MRREEFESRVHLILSCNAGVLLDELESQLYIAKARDEKVLVMVPSRELPATYGLICKGLGKALTDSHATIVTQCITDMLNSRNYNIDCNSVMMFINTKEALTNLRVRKRFKHQNLMRA